MTEFRACAVIPTYENPATVRDVVVRVREHVADVFLIDDGSGPVGAAACRAVEGEGLTTLIVRPRNGGKGAAVKTGLAAAAAAGFTHALQVDADGQHEIARAVDFIAAARATPEALVLGYPEYDETAPRVRRTARLITRFWVDLEVGRGVIRDALVGFRVYPVRSALAARALGDRMEFDPEIAVLMAMGGTPIVNLPVRIRYLTAEEGGRSHFRPFADSLRLSWMHGRVITAACSRWVLRRLGLMR